MNNTTLNMVYLDDGKAIIKQKGNGGGNDESANPTGAVNDVTFYDYDGTVLYGFSKDRFLLLEEMPELPTQDGLVGQGWNWDWESARSYVSKYGILDVGAIYTTDDGATRVYITLPTNGQLNVHVYITQTVSNGVIVDWGDGSATETINGTGAVNASHRYTGAGDYRISLLPQDDCVLGFGDGNLYNIVEDSNSLKIYSNFVTKVNVGKNVPTITSRSLYGLSLRDGVSVPTSVTTLANSALSSTGIPCFVCTPSMNNFNVYGVISDKVSTFVYSSKSSTTLTSLATNSFRAFNNVQRLVLPDGIRSIENNALSYVNSLTSLVIPSTVTAIWSDALSGNLFSCGYLDFSHVSRVPSLSSSLPYLTEQCKIIVPDELYDEWISATNWSAKADQTVKKSDWDNQNA